MQLGIQITYQTALLILIILVPIQFTHRIRNIREYISGILIFQIFHGRDRLEFISLIQSSSQGGIVRDTSSPRMRKRDIFSYTEMIIKQFILGIKTTTHTLKIAKLNQSLLIIVSQRE